MPHLNVLLSFAQFEREVTAERIRDKIAASKRKGMWMGGVVPLAYDARDRKLWINPSEAETVRLIFRRYLDCASVHDLKDALDRDGIRSKPRIRADGSIGGGKPFSRGALYVLLSNPIYLGEIRHGAHRHPGRYEAIVDQALWDAVQPKLADHAVRRSTGCDTAATSPLAGLVFDANGDRLTPSHANKRGRRYRYYISRALVIGNAAKHRQGWRLPAPDLEQAVGRAAAAMLANQSKLPVHLIEAGVDLPSLPGALAAAGQLSQELEDGVDTSHLAQILRRVEIAEDGLTLPIALDAFLSAPPREALMITHTLPMTIRRRGVEMRLVIGEAVPATKADPALLKSIARGRRWWAELASGIAPSIAVIARRDGVSDGYVGHLLPLAFLAPSIVEAIAAGRHPVNLTAETLVKRIDLPLCWERQRALLGCG